MRFKHLILGMILVASAFVVLGGCRRDVDRMAEFCLGYVEATKTDDCGEMARNLEQLLAEPQPRLREASTICDRRTVCDADGKCAEVSACDPCRVGIQAMLRKCGQDEGVSRIMKEEMHFSTALRDQIAVSY